MPSSAFQSSWAQESLHHTCIEVIPDNWITLLTTTSCILLTRKPTDVSELPTSSPDLPTLHGPVVHSSPAQTIASPSTITIDLNTTVTLDPGTVTVTLTTLASTSVKTDPLPLEQQQQKEQLYPSAIAGISVLSVLAFFGLGVLIYYLRRRALRRRAAESVAKAGFFRGLFSRDDPLVNIRSTADYLPKLEEHELRTRFA